jgi:hypothetical protein
LCGYQLVNATLKHNGIKTAAVQAHGAGTATAVWLLLLLLVGWLRWQLRLLRQLLLLLLGWHL